MSLSSLASPRATEPKTRTLRAPSQAAIRRISSRFSWSKFLEVIAECPPHRAQARHRSPHRIVTDDCHLEKPVRIVKFLFAALLRRPRPEGLLKTPASGRRAGVQTS